MNIHFVAILDPTNLNVTFSSFSRQVAECRENVGAIERFYYSNSPTFDGTCRDAKSDTE
jgi:hypothetical protein